MPRSHRTGLNVVRKKRADGSIKTYCYDIKTGAFLSHDREEALALLRGDLKPGVRPDTIAGLIARYKSGPAFRKLKPRTQELYSHYLKQIETGWGDCHAKDIRPATIETIKETLQGQPSRCNMTLALMRIVLGLAVRLEYVRENVAVRPGRISAPPRTTIWAVSQEDEFLRHAPPSLQLAFMLLLYTVQRPSDVLDMTTDRISEREGRMFIALRQAKTGALLDIPVHQRLRPLLRQRLDQARPGDRLVASPTGRPWSRRNFSRSWDQVMTKAGLSDLQRRDLRRTGIVRLAECGATTAQIAAVSGHGIDFCQRIIDTYLPRRTEVALAAIELWERAGGRTESNVVRLAARMGTR